MLIKIKNILLLGVVFCLSCSSPSDEQEVSNPKFEQLILKSRSIADTNLNKSFNYIDSAYATFENPSLKDKWRCLYFKFGMYYNKSIATKNKDDLNNSMVFADSMLLILKDKPEKKYVQELYTSSFAKADVLIELNKYDEAYPYYFKGKQLTDTSKTKCELYNFNRRFAFLMYKKGDYQEAAYFYKESYRNKLSCTEDPSNYYAIVNALVGAGQSYFSLQITDSAIVYYDKAIAYMEKNPMPHEEQFSRVKSSRLNLKMHVYINLINAYFDRGQLDSAKKRINQLLLIGRDKNLEQKNVQRANIKLAHIFLNEGKPDSTKKLIATVEQSLKLFPNNSAAMLLHKLKHDYLLQNGNVNEAAINIKAYLNLKDQIEKSKMSVATADQQLYKLQKNYEVNLLKQKNKLNNFYLIFALVIFIMSILMILGLWHSVRKTKANNRALDDLNLKMVKQNEYLLQTLAHLEDTKDENNTVMQMITHDLRSPMAAIVGLSGFMIAEHNLSEDDLEVIQLINVSGLDSLKFINDILDKETAAGELKKEFIDLQELLTYGVMQLRYKAKDKNQTITLKSVPVNLLINREKIWRVISNLITNAIKFSATETLIEVGLMAKDGHAIITVKDNGIGIPDHLKEAIFSKGSEGHRLGTGGEKSFGLGLLISKQIIEEHGGNLYFESEQGKGTTFFISLPIVV